MKLAKTKIPNFIAGHGLFLLLPLIAVLIFMITTNLIFLSKVLTKKDIVKLLREQSTQIYCQYYGEVLGSASVEAHDSTVLKFQNIKMIGRASFDVGIDYSKVSAENVIFDEDEKKIILVALRPQILNSNFGQWFIPSQRIKGFEIVNVRDSDLKHFTPKDFKNLRFSILNALTKRAVEQGSLIKAQEIAIKEIQKVIAVAYDENVTVIFQSELANNFLQ
jgi:hypothetical protein